MRSRFHYVVLLPACLAVLCLGSPIARSQTTPGLSPALPSTPDQTEALLKRRPDTAAGGIYKLDDANAFNVLDSVYYDTASSQLSLVGHYDKRFGGANTPYLQHLAILLKSPKPEFSLTWTDRDSEQRVQALFTMHLSAAQGDKIAGQWGKTFDEQGNITEAGRLLLPVMGVSPIEGNRAPGALGVEVSPVADSTAVRISNVVPGSPAAQAGLQPGSLIIRFRGIAPFSPAEFYRMVRTSGAGSHVSIQYIQVNNGQIGNYSSQVTLTADSDPNVWKDAIGADALRGLYLAAGDRRAADVANAIEIMNHVKSTSPDVSREMRVQLIAALGLRNAVDADIQAMNSGALTQIQGFYDVYLKQCEALDEVFHFTGSPVKNAFIRAYEQKKVGTPGTPCNLQWTKWDDSWFSKWKN